MGEFKDGMMSGQGILTYKDGFGGGGKAVYSGNFRHNKRDGYGELVWGNSRSGGEGEMYKGLWHNDYRVKGWIRLQDGTVFDGEWRNDVWHGQGRLTFKPDGKDAKGIIYEGLFIDGT